VLQLLQQDKWQVKFSKCSFAQRKIDYLGHVISGDGVATNPAKITPIEGWPVPENTKMLRSFLGLVGYYRKFVRNFGIICKPLTELLKKHSLFQWTSVHQDAFTALKQTLVHAPVLTLPDFSKQFILETDASDMGVGVVLMQQGILWLTLVRLLIQKLEVPQLMKRSI
jgi:hypothetical protein